MPTPIKNIPKTAVFLDSTENPTTRIIQENLVSGNNEEETFTLRTSLLNSPLLSVSKDSETLKLDNPVKVQYGQFVLIYKSISIAPYTLAQQYAFPIQLEILNPSTFEEQFPPEFTELV